jgi:signal peptidase I
VVAALVLATVAAGAVRRVEVIGESMAPRLLPGDRLLVVRLPVRWPLRVGELVALPDPRTAGLWPGWGRVLVKRVAVVEGGAVTVLGDDPDRSTDSRDFGPVPRASISGRAVYRYHPPRRAGRLA